MRRWEWVSSGLLVFCLAAHAACGSDDSSSGGGGGNDGGGSGDGGGSSSDGGGGGDGSANACEAARADIERLRPAAIACTNGRAAQCTQLVADICCSVSVTDSNSPAVIQFEQAVRKYKDELVCPHVCPAIACSDQPSKTCQINGNTCKQTF